MAQLVEHILGKDEVPSSNLGSSSKQKSSAIAEDFLFRVVKGFELHIFALQKCKRLRLMIV